MIPSLSSWTAVLSSVVAWIQAGKHRKKCCPAVLVPHNWPCDTLSPGAALIFLSMRQKMWVCLCASHTDKRSARNKIRAASPAAPEGPAARSADPLCISEAPPPPRLFLLKVTASVLWPMRPDIVPHTPLTLRCDSVTVTVLVRLCLHLHPCVRESLKCTFSISVARSLATADVCCLSNGVKRAAALTSAQPAPGQWLGAGQIWIITPLQKAFFFPLLFLKAQSVPLIVQSFG